MTLWLCLLIPLLFIVGMIYNALKEQKRLEKEILKPLIEKRKQERAALEEKLKAAGDLKGLETLASKPLFEDPYRKEEEENS